MHQRLSAPVRVKILGFPGVGKSTLLNFLAGQEILSSDVPWKSLELCWGKITRTTATLADGSVHTYDGLALAKITDRAQVSVRIEIDLPVLRKLSLKEITVSPDATEIGRVGERSDIALWCSQEFNHDEQRLWADVSDALKDHSFFVLTKADVLSANGTLHSRIESLQNTVADEFYSLIPIATQQALTAVCSDDGTDDVALAESGGKALITALLHQVQLGRQSDLDSAQLFLQRYGAGTNNANAAMKDPVPGTMLNLQAEIVESKETEPKDPQTIPVNEISQRAIDIIRAQADDLHQEDKFDELLGASNILDECVNTANQLVEIFESVSS
ncbi:MAG: GTPase, partial [Paracoccaceae bacterium]